MDDEQFRAMMKIFWVNVYLLVTIICITSSLLIINLLQSIMNNIFLKLAVFMTLMGIGSMYMAKWDKKIKPYL